MVFAEATTRVSTRSKLDPFRPPKYDANVRNTMTEDDWMQVRHNSKNFNHSSKFSWFHINVDN